MKHGEPGHVCKANPVYASRLTIQQAQRNQPWNVPYSAGVQAAADHVGTEPLVPHILGTHTVLHAIKSLGKIAAVYEARDHRDDPERYGVSDRNAIRAMAADLMTAALRFANLEGFDLAEALVERVAEKNGGADFGPLPTPHEPYHAEVLDRIARRNAGTGE